MSHEHYFIDVRGYDRLDVYRLIELIGITCPVAQHVFKKAFATGKRGHKDLRRDWQDIADSAARRLQMIDEDIAITDRLTDALGGKAAFGQQNTIDYRTKEERAADIGRQLADGVRRAASGAVCNDPRTVVGLDVSFPTEKHMNFAPDEKCDCHRCIAEQGLGVGGLPLNMLKMILCPVCGNKRCPKANDHRNDCTGSNEPGQPGSAYQ